jgi:hypothetical protein
MGKRTDEKWNISGGCQVLVDIVKPEKNGYMVRETAMDRRTSIQGGRQGRC